MLWLGAGGAASAEPLDLAAYRARVAAARALLASARSADLSSRPASVERARELLASADEVRVDAETVRQVDDRALAARLGTSDEALDRAIVECDRLLAFADAALRADRLGGATADARLADALRDLHERAAPATIPALIGALFDRWLRSLVLPDISGLAVASRLLLVVPLVLALLVILGRGIRERVRREDLVPTLSAERSGDPAERLREADAALAAGRGREAVHALYLYAIAALVAREAIRYDPALTDAELLQRAAAVPRADALRDLIALHERVWFGLRAPVLAEQSRARRLALAVAP